MSPSQRFSPSFIPLLLLSLPPLSLPPKISSRVDSSWILLHCIHSDIPARGLGSLESGLDQGSSTSSDHHHYTECNRYPICVHQLEYIYRHRNYWSRVSFYCTHYKTSCTHTYKGTPDVFSPTFKVQLCLCVIQNDACLYISKALQVVILYQVTSLTDSSGILSTSAFAIACNNITHYHLPVDRALI